jgi:hypothetical protein
LSNIWFYDRRNDNDIVLLSMSKKIKLLSLLVLVLFCGTSFLNFSKSFHHSLDSVSDLSHFHSSPQNSEHHEDAKSHSDEENETMVSLEPSTIRNTSYSLDFNVVVFSVSRTNQLYFEAKDYAGKLSGVDPPINRLDFRSFYPNAPPSLA